MPNGGSGDRPPPPTVGDLFYDSDPEQLLLDAAVARVEAAVKFYRSDGTCCDDLDEGTLWWNSSSDGRVVGLMTTVSAPARYGLRHHRRVIPRAISFA